MRRLLLFICACLFASAAVAADSRNASPGQIRIKDLGKLQGWRENSLVGWGIVTGLAGTGDSPSNRTTRQALSNVFAQFNLAVPADQVQSRNVAVVMVSASLPAFAHEGDAVDVTVGSAGDARSLVGGTLLVTPLKGPDGRVHALAQGQLAVGGYRYDSNGNVVQKNHPTVGSIPGGATVEVGVANDIADSAQLTFVLADPDYTTASRVAAAMNAQIEPGIAHARDASGIDITIPQAHRGQLVAFVAKLENVAVEPDRRARVVINERTGIVVAGGDVTISRVSISHGDLKVNVTAQTSVSQPTVIGEAGPAVRTATVTNSRVDVDEDAGPGYLASGTTVSDLVQSLARLKTPTRDVISILRAIKAAGALHAELVVQ